eukprot:4160969-Amphidinium_carterae.4
MPLHQHQPHPQRGQSHQDNIELHRYPHKKVTAEVLERLEDHHVQRLRRTTHLDASNFACTDDMWIRLQSTEAVYRMYFNSHPTSGYDHLVAELEHQSVRELEIEDRRETRVANHLEGVWIENGTLPSRKFERRTTWEQVSYQTGIHRDEYLNNYWKNDPQEVPGHGEQFEHTYYHLLVLQTTKRTIWQLTFCLSSHRRRHGHGRIQTTHWEIPKHFTIDQVSIQATEEPTIRIKDRDQLQAPHRQRHSDYKQRLRPRLREGLFTRCSREILQDTRENTDIAGHSMIRIQDPSYASERRTLQDHEGSRI